MDTCMCMAECLCCPSETITILLIGYTPIQKKKFRKKSSLLLPFLLSLPLCLTPSSSFIYLFIIKKPPNIKNIINVEKNHRPSVLYLPFPVNRPLTELGSPRGRRHFKDAHRCCRTGEKPGSGRAGGRGERGESSAGTLRMEPRLLRFLENSLSLLPLLLNLSQDAGVLLSKSIERKQLWFACAFTATRTGLGGGAPSSHVAFCPPPLSVA